MVSSITISLFFISIFLSWLVVVLYFIIKKHRSKDSNDKVALAYHRDMVSNKVIKLEIFDEKDDKVQSISGIFKGASEIL